MLVGLKEDVATTKYPRYCCEKGRLAFKALHDLHLLFFVAPMANVPRVNEDVFYSPFNFASIPSYPITFTGSSTAPIFNGTKAVFIELHVKAMNKYMRNHSMIYLDQKLKCLACSLKGDVGNWFTSLPNNSIATIATMETVFLNKWAEKMLMFLQR